MGTVSPENMILLGKVVRPHGLEGVLRVKSYAQSEESFLKAKTLFLKTSSGETIKYGVVFVRPHKNIYLMKLKGLRSLEEAENYRGAKILVSKDTLSRESGEYFWHELVGLKVYLSGGAYIGTIEQILPTRANDIYVVRDGEKEVLIPAIDEVVTGIDLASGRMTITEMEGMLDLNEV